MLTIQIPDINPADEQLAQTIRAEVASVLYQQKVWSLGQAARFTGMAYIQFQDFLASRSIPLNYDEADLMNDIQASKDFMKR
ncbi:MAG: UPF0175 family protein [Bacteroidota bacterium]